MIEYNKMELLKKTIEKDEQLSQPLTEELLGMCTILGGRPAMLQGVYKTLRKKEECYHSKPIIGAEVTFSFDYREKTMTFTRPGIVVTVTIPALWRLLGWIDACYSMIYPIGSVAELDMELAPEPLRPCMQKKVHWYF
jgi:hypothetical protein